MGAGAGAFYAAPIRAGLSSHTGMTATSRAYQKNRGRATALVQLGFAGLRFPGYGHHADSAFWLATKLVGVWRFSGAGTATLFLAAGIAEQRVMYLLGRLIAHVLCTASAWCCRFMLRRHFCCGHVFPPDCFGR